MLYNMYLSAKKLLNIKFILADVSKAELAKVLEIDPAILSREIKNKELLQKIDQYIDSINPEVNQIVNSIVSNNSESNQVSEPKSKYSSDWTEKDAKIRELTVESKRLERILNITERMIDRLENENFQLIKQLDQAQRDIDKNKQVG